ncbi:MAG TPA: hypothetical protein VFA37_07940 [Gaiellaceae bacterium]|nr:hypothetical protein [Gaiellaceae bacterium]
MRKLLALSKTSKLLLATVMSVTVFGSVYGFAASLGISTSGLGADNKVIASCGSGMTFAYTTTYYSGLPGYAVNGISLSSIPSGCYGKSLAVTFSDSGNAALGSEVTATLPSAATGSVSITPATNDIDASKVANVSVVVS